jgi:hypothetical protein
MQTKEEEREYQKQWYIRNKEKINTRSKEYYDTHKEERIRNKEKIKAESKEYYDTHKKERIEYSKEYRKNNVEKIRKYRRQYDKNNSLKKKNTDIKRKYGITLEEYNIIHNKQENKCLICGKHQSEIKIPFAIDHNHKTGKIRGLLCGKCNLGLGYFDDNINLLLKAVKYLK